MNKSVVHTILSFVVAFSLLAPAIVPLLKVDGETIVWIDITEDESKKESKKEIEEKEVYFQDLTGFDSDDALDESLWNHAYFALWLEGSTEIILPPPEHNV